jgi:phosphoribosylaminoimidazole-succinocarboxamide synthase
MAILLQTDLPLHLFQRGKVRDIYTLGDKLLVVSTDRISAFDSVLPCGIPGKGTVLNQLSSFWFEKTAYIIPNHFIKLIDSDAVLNEVKKLSGCAEKLPRYLIGRSMIVARAKRIPIECVVRGYICGSAWQEYKESGAIHGIPFPSGLKECQELPHPIFTPTTKSDVEHDRPLTQEDIKSLGIENLIGELERKSLLIYQYAQNYAQGKGIIIADTKFEFGFVDGELKLIDELLTPDSSRFWDASQYRAQGIQVSFDKQPLRDWLLASGWNKEPPAPMLPPDIIEATAERYNKIYRLFTGKEL